MWYCVASFISGKEKNIIFSSEKEANEFFQACRFSSASVLQNKYDGFLIFLKNLETISKPEKYVAKLESDRY